MFAGRNDMNCKKAEKEITDFLNKEMDIYKLSDFLSHIDKCEDCKEELSIQFLVTEGLNALENGDSYDLNNSLDARLAEARHSISVNRRLFWIRNIAFGVVIAVFIAFVWLIYMFL